MKLTCISSCINDYLSVPCILNFLLYWNMIYIEYVKHLELVPVYSTRMNLYLKIHIYRLRTAVLGGNCH